MSHRSHLSLTAVFLLVFVRGVSAEPAVGTPNDSARFLAGLTPSTGSPLEPLTQQRAWIKHAAFFDGAWARLDLQQLSKVRAWSAEYVRDPSPTAFYMFSGPDFLYVNAIFPAASTYVLCGKEPVGRVPDLTRLAPAQIESSLANLESSLNSVLSFSFFITKELRSDQERIEVQGTLPLLYAFLARTGNTIHEVSFIGLDRQGTEVQTAGKGITPGVQITFTAAGGSVKQTLYYFDTDVSDDGIKQNPGFMNFCQRLAPGDSFLKAASYLPHEHGFEKISDFLLRSSRILIQDDSGIPIRFFDPHLWKLRLFGRYKGPIDIFKQWYQPQLAAMYERSNPMPLDFGIGYRHFPGASALIVAMRK